MSAKIRVAISGGLAGAVTCHAVLQHAHLDVHIFESAPAFKKVEAAIGVALNAQAGPVPEAGVRFKIGYGSEKGSVIDEVVSKGDAVVGIAHRAAFLRELLAVVPADCVHVSKKLSSVTEAGQLTLHLQDGSAHDCDIPFGADGIHSRVRKPISGARDPAATPVCAITGTCRRFDRTKTPGGIFARI